MSLPLTLAAVCAGVALAWLPAARAEHAVDANIITGLDASDSIMRHEEWIELDGMIRAVSHPTFLAAVRAGRHRRVGFAAFAWSSHGDLRVVVPWAELGSAADAERVARALAKAPRRGHATFGGDQGRAGAEAPSSPDRMTDVSAALRHGLDLLAAAPHKAERSVLNICGNGVDNVGEGPERIKDLALEAGVTVNGLVIGEEPGLAAYYRERVATGPGSFVIVAQQPADATDAMLRKFLLDLLSFDARGGQRTAMAGSSGSGSSARRGRRAAGRTGVASGQVTGPAASPGDVLGQGQGRGRAAARNKPARQAFLGGGTLPEHHRAVVVGTLGGRPWPTRSARGWSRGRAPPTWSAMPSLWCSPAGAARG